MNNNIFKKSILSFCIDANINLVAYEEQSLSDLQACNFVLKIRSNQKVIHRILFDYHLRVLEITSNLNNDTPTAHSFDGISRLFQFVNDFRAKRDLY